MQKREPFTALGQIDPSSKADIARAITQVEARPFSPASLAVLDDAWAHPMGQALGLTGPPGVGKSTLTQAFLDHWRGLGKRVAVLAVDPSSQKSGGSLLGDRTRLKLVASDANVFVRSIAAGKHLGGLSASSFPILVLLRALYDYVLIETVGVGQSETEITNIADAVGLCVQPGSGDSLQFMKAGIAEIPDIIFVTKGDLGALADRAVADMKGALSLSADSSSVPKVFKLSAKTRDGVAEAVEAVDSVLAGDADGRRAAHIQAFSTQSIAEKFGSEGVQLATPVLRVPAVRPFGKLSELLGRLSVNLS